MKIITILLQLILVSSINSQWTLEGTLPNDSLGNQGIRKVCVIDSSVSWAFGLVRNGQNQDYPSFARRTINGWKVIKTDLDSNIKGYCFTAIDSLRVWLGTFHPDEIYYSSNGGINWNLQNHVADTGHVVGITFCKQNNQIGYAFAHLAFGTFWNGVCILKTTNGGLNWSRWNFEYYGYKCTDNSMSVVDSNYAWFGADDVLSSNSKIISTTNGGLSWSVTDINAGNDAPFTIQFSDDKQTGLFVGQTPPTTWFYRTTNAGINWNIIYTTSYYYSKTMRWVQGTSNIYSNSEFVIVNSIDKGLTWRTMTGITGGSVESMDAVRINDRTIYALAVSYNRKIYKLLDTARIIGIENPVSIIPKEFKLYQNFPNPFNPVTKISFDLPEKSIVNLIVYDILGRIVAYLENNNLKQAGSYITEFDASNYSSGIYFYQLKAGDFVQSKKMVIVK